MSNRKMVTEISSSKLIDDLDRAVKHYANLKISTVDEAKVVQFHEISKTIERLRDAGTVVPDELRKLKIDLSLHAATFEEAEKLRREALVELQEMERRLSNTLTGIRYALSKISGAKQTKGKRFVKRTSPTILAKEIRKALRELGGSAKKNEVLGIIRRSMDGKFKQQDLERDVRGELNWERWIVAEKDKMLKSGDLMAGTSFGIWTLRKK